MAVSAHLVRQMNVGFQEIFFTWRGPSAPSPHIDAEGKFVSARTIRSPWPWWNTLVMEEHVWSGKLEMLQKNKGKKCPFPQPLTLTAIFFFTIEARMWRRSGVRQGGIPFSTMFEQTKLSLRYLSTVYKVSKMSLEYCLLANMCRNRFKAIVHLLQMICGQFHEFISRIRLIVWCTQWNPTSPNNNLGALCFHSKFTGHCYKHNLELVSTTAHGL